MSRKEDGVLLEVGSLGRNARLALLGVRAAPHGRWYYSVPPSLRHPPSRPRSPRPCCRHTLPFSLLPSLPPRRVHVDIDVRGSSGVVPARQSPVPVEEGRDHVHIEADARDVTGSRKRPHLQPAVLVFSVWKRREGGGEGGRDGVGHHNNGKEHKFYRRDIQKYR